MALLVLCLRLGLTFADCLVCRKREEMQSVLQAQRKKAAA